MRALSQAWKAYEKAVYMAAEENFQRVVKPWLVKKGYDFSAGMGSWSVHYRAVSERTPVIQTILNDECIPKRVLDVLNQDVEGFNQDLGSLMPSYLANGFVYPETKANR